MAMTRNLFTKIKPLFSLIRPFSAVPDARAELAAVKAWDAKMCVAAISAKAKRIEADMHLATEKAAIEAGQAPDSAAVLELKAKAKACMAAADAQSALIKALTAKGEAREPMIKARLVELKAKMKDSSVSCVGFERLTELVEADKVHIVLSMVDIYKSIAMLETQLVRVQAYNPRTEAQIAESQKQFAESCAQMKEICEQKAEFEAKTAEINKAAASAAKTGTWERATRSFW